MNKIVISANSSILRFSNEMFIWLAENYPDVDPMKLSRYDPISIECVEYFLKLDDRFAEAYSIVELTGDKYTILLVKGDTDTLVEHVREPSNYPWVKIPKPVETVALKDVTGYFKLSLESPATYSKLKLRSDSNAGPINCVSFMNGQCTGTVVPMQNIYLAVFPVDDLN